jgi:hypothetical protein
MPKYIMGMTLGSAVKAGRQFHLGQLRIRTGVQTEASIQEWDGR